MRLLLITGLSGAGKSTALKAMEDSGYETIDNMPLSLLPLLLSSEAATEERMLVVGSDIRSRGFSPENVGEAIATVRADGAHTVSLLFLTCDDDALQRRYTETRRKHPLAQDRPVLAGIRQERALLADIRAQADVILDTTHFTPAELRRAVQQSFAPDSSPLSIFVQSFSFKKGIPREADILFDVRFLRNPYYDPALRPLSGKDAPVADYIRADEAYPTFFAHLTELLTPLLPRYRQEGKSYLTIAIGCTGGQHRSVFVAGQLVDFWAGQGYAIDCYHRDLAK